MALVSKEERKELPLEFSDFGIHIILNFFLDIGVQSGFFGILFFVKISSFTVFLGSAYDAWVGNFPLIVSTLA